MIVCRGTPDNPGCSRPYEAVYSACPFCGVVPPLPEPSSRSIEQVAGDLMLLDTARLAAMRAATELETPASIANRVAFVAGGAAGQRAVNSQMAKFEAQQRLKDAIAQWAGVQRARGRSDSESYRRFYLATGVDVLSAMSADRSRDDMERLAATVERWYG
jgi:hypothetical protein